VQVPPPPPPPKPKPKPKLEPSAKPPTKKIATHSR